MKHENTTFPTKEVVQNHFIGQDFPFKEDDKTWTFPHEMINVKHRLVEDGDGLMPTFKFNLIFSSFWRKMST